MITIKELAAVRAQVADRDVTIAAQAAQIERLTNAANDFSARLDDYLSFQPSGYMSEQEKEWERLSSLLREAQETLSDALQAGEDAA